MENENYYTETNKVTFLLKTIQFYYRYLGSVFPRFSAYLFGKLFSSIKKRKFKEKHLSFLSTAETKRVFIEDHDIQFYFWGSGVKKILIVHGWEGMSADFSEMVDDLIKNGFSVVSFDLPGHGKSSGKFTHLPMIISLLKKVIPDFGPFYGVIGHSLGAAASAFSLAELNGNISIDKLALMGLHPIPFSFFKQFRQVLKINDALFEKCVVYVENKVGKKVREMSVQNVLSTISARKVILVHDEKDEVVNIKTIEKLNKEWEKSELFTGKHGGHYRHYKHPEVVQRVVQFMKE